MFFHLALLKRVLGVLGLLCSLLALSLLVPATSQARVGSCTGDPQIALSNGRTIALTETISTDASNVTAITYTYHLPSGVSVTQIVKSNTGISAKEVDNFYFDSPANTYKVDLLVSVTGSAVAASDKMTIGTASTTVSSQTGQHLSTTLVVK